LGYSVFGVWRGVDGRAEAELTSSILWGRQRYEKMNTRQLLRHQILLLDILFVVEISITH
jgi:hypothetical protein